MNFYREQGSGLEEFQKILASEKKALEELVAKLEKELRQERNERAYDNARMQDKLRQMISSYEIRIDNVSREAQELYKMFTKELGVKDSILEQTNELKEILAEKVKRLTLMLKTPRHHLQFLSEKGMIDPFISAKLTGEDINAKWILKKAARKEITDIVEDK